jgi:signal transduction histidine kinase
LNLKTKFSFYFTGPLLVVMLCLGAGIVSFERIYLLRESDKRQVELVNKLAQTCVDASYGNDLILFDFFRSLESETGFAGAAMTDKNNRVNVHSDLSKIGSFLPPFLPPFKGREDIRKQRIVSDDHGQMLIDWGIPVYDKGVPIGVARLFFDEKSVKAHINSTIKTILKPVVLIGFLALMMGFAGAWLLARAFIAPIDRVIHGMHHLAMGDLRPIPESMRKDELGQMISEFNTTIDKLKELDLMKKEFISSVTHELRSPLTAIERFVSLLLKGTYGRLAPDQQESLMIVKNNTVRLNTFIDDVLTTAKLDYKRAELFYEEIDVRDVISDVANLFSSFSACGTVHLEVKLPVKPVMAITDRSILTHILCNLVSNGFKFTPHGEIILQLTESAEVFEIKVKDTGIGIPPQEKTKIFEKFFRGEASAHTTKGTGLGLSIVKAYMDLLHGTIVVGDNPKGGTVFTVLLPRS